MRGRARAGPGVDRARPGRRLGHGAPRLRPHARGPRGQRRRLQRLRRPHVRDACGRPAARRWRAPAGRMPLACTQLHHEMEGRAIVRTGTLEQFTDEPRASRRHIEPDAAQDADAVPRRTSTRATRGAWRSTSTPASAATPAWSPARPRTTSRWSARSRWRKRPRDALAPHRHLLQGHAGRPRDVSPAGAVPALRERAVRGGLPGGGDGPQRRRPERHGLQPLRRHALLLEQLPVQGAPLQLPALLRTGTRRAEDGAQPRRHGAQPRRDGEVHLLRAAHQPRADRAREGGPHGRATARSSPPASRPARPRRSSSATSTTRTAASRSCAAEARNYALLAS